MISIALGLPTVRLPDNLAATDVMAILVHLSPYDKMEKTPRRGNRGFPVNAIGGDVALNEPG
jgi:hypothetical protein